MLRTPAGTCHAVVLQGRENRKKPGLAEGAAVEDAVCDDDDAGVAERVSEDVGAARQPAAAYCTALHAAMTKLPSMQQSQHREPDAGQLAQSVLGPCAVAGLARARSSKSSIAR